MRRRCLVACDDVGPVGYLVRVGELPGHLHSQAGTETIYAYKPDDSATDYYPNVFRVRGRTFAVALIAEGRNARYAKDTIGIYELTDDDNIVGQRFHIQDQTRNKNLNELDYALRIRNDRLTLTDQRGRREFYAASIRNLYWWRYHTAEHLVICGDNYNLAQQGGPAGTLLYFDLIPKGEVPIPIVVAQISDINGRRVDRVRLTNDCEIVWSRSGCSTEDQAANRRIEQLRKSLSEQIVASFDSNLKPSNSCHRLMRCGLDRACNYRKAHSELISVCRPRYRSE